MKERLSELGYVVWLTIIGLIVLALLAVGTLGIQRVVYPKWLSVQRSAVEQSKSFTDANNNMLETYKLEYVRLDAKIAGSNEAVATAYKAQQGAILGKMCTEIATMSVGTVNPNTLSWLNSKGGCR